MNPIDVLVVEDNLMNTHLLKAVLREPGFRLTTAGSAEEAFLLLEDKIPDVILMDLGLPGIDGYDAIKRIKSSERLRNIPVAVVSAFARTDERDKAHMVGASHFLSKPIDVRTFPDQVRQLVLKN